MKKTAIRIILLLIFCVVMAMFCTSCAGNSFDGTATAYLNAFQKFDYRKMYDLLTPGAQGRVDYDEFADYHKKVYDLLKITGVTVKRGEKTDNGISQSFDYTAEFTSSEYGTFTYDMQLEIIKKAGFYLVSWTPANVVSDMNWNDRIYGVTLKGKRGEIFDRDGRIIVQNDYAVTVYADRIKIAAYEEKNNLKFDINSTIKNVASILNLDYSKVAETYEKSAGGTGVLATMFKGELSSEQEAKLSELEFVYVDRSSVTPIRYYPYKEALSQTLGYSTPITPEDREKPEYKYLDEGTRIGRTGLEAAYDSYLQPKKGYQVYLLSDDSKTKTVLYSEDAQDGYDLVLTVDMLVQKNVSDYMKEHYNTQSTGTANIINPKTGAVVTLVSYPGYDGNVYSTDKATNYGDLFDNPHTPLLNRNVQGTYPPGSIFKSIMACIGLESGTVTTNTVFPYENEIEYYTFEKDRWRPKGSKWSTYIVRQAFRNANVTGSLDMHRALTWSDNIYFGWLAMRVGKESLMQYAQKIGIGESIPFDLKVKASQLYNQEKTLDSLKLLADTGFGQAEVLFSPLQLCATFSLFGNGGTIMQPYIVQSICSTDENGNHVEVQTTEPKVYKKVFNENTVLTVRSILENTAKNGTGKSGIKGLTNIRVASKTGTAQTGTTETGEVGWYAGYVIEGGENDAVLVSADESDLKFATVNFVFAQLQNELLG